MKEIDRLYELMLVLESYPTMEDGSNAMKEMLQIITDLLARMDPDRRP